MSREFVKIVGRFFTTKDLDIFVLNAEKREWKEGKENGGRVMDDLISREQAIDALDKDPMGGLNYNRILNNLPSAQKTGKWIKKKNIRLGDYIECSRCKNAESRIAPGWWNAKKYCPNCGARMVGEEE